MRAAVWLAASVAAAQIRSPETSTFHATAPLVVAPVTVTGGDGKLVDGLRAEDFELYDNSKLRAVDADGAVPPVALVLVIENGHPAAAALTKAQHAGSLIEPLLTGQRGKAALVTFSDEVRVPLTFTRGGTAVTTATRAIRTRGDGIRVIDALDRAIRLLAESAPDHRRVILLISQQRDQGSETKLEDALTSAQRENVLIYSLTYSPFLSRFTVKQDEVPPPQGMNLMALFSLLAQQGKKSAADLFARQTGGRRLSFLTQESLETAISTIGEELHGQYLLSFEPRDTDRGKFHRIEVRVKRNGVAVRTRPGYWLP